MGPPDSHFQRQALSIGRVPSAERYTPEQGHRRQAVSLARLLYAIGRITPSLNGEWAMGRIYEQEPSAEENFAGVDPAIPGESIS